MGKLVWLEVHGESHWSLFSSGYGVALQKRFFDHFLKRLDNGWERTPPVTLNVRHPGERFVLRHEHEWPLGRTAWTKLYLDPAHEEAIAHLALLVDRQGHAAEAQVLRARAKRMASGRTDGVGPDA